MTLRWVLTIKTGKHGNFLKAKATWVLRGFPEKQKEYQPIDSRVSTKHGFRMCCQIAASKSCNIFHIDLKTAFLQGQSYGVNRDVVCQQPPEAGHTYIAARLKKPAYGMNDASRRWWNILGKALCSYGMVPTRADRCCYVLYSTQSRERTRNQNKSTNCHDAAFEKMLHPIARTPAAGKSVVGIIDLFVDDLFGTGGTEMEQRVPARLRKEFQVGSEDWNDVTFTRQRILWMKDLQLGSCTEVSQQKAMDELQEIPVERNMKEDLHCIPAMHTKYRSLLGLINWLQSRTQFPCCYRLSRCASKAASPAIGDVNVLNKLARQLKSQPVKLQFWPLTRPSSIIGFPDAFYRKQRRWIFTTKHDSVFSRSPRATIKRRNNVRKSF